jgi:hypothetical protein
MSADARPIRIILDTSAILRFVQGSVHVGEPIAEVESEGGVVGLPVLCLSEARGLAHDQATFDLLTRHPATTVVPAADEWDELASEYEVVGRLDATVAVHEAIARRVALLTARPGLYGGMPDGGPVIAIP